MNILNAIGLESNTQIHFNGGDLSYDAGLLVKMLKITARVIIMITVVDFIHDYATVNHSG